MPWFDLFPWLIALAPFLGLFCSAFVKRRDPEIVGNKVYRHDPPARVSHWSHALGTTVCIVSGIVMGLRFTPAFVDDGPNAILWMNVHFVACVLFLFGTFFYLGNTIISRYRFKEHLPTKNAIGYTVRHYGLLIGIKKFTMPPEDKYFESEKVAYVYAVVVSVLLVASGLLKAFAHVFLSLPDAFMNVMSWTHDIAAVAMLLFLLAHVFFAVIAPFSWKTFPSMFTGWVPKEEADKEHAGWVSRLEQSGAVRPEDNVSDVCPPAGEPSAAASSSTASGR